jgi:carbon monoxide dehydrogenase subunit G
MKLSQQLVLAEPPATVWAFFEDPRRVAACVPGMEEIETLGPDQYRARISQKVGPISATFSAKVMVVEKVARERMRLVSTGQALRGAAGSFRSEATLRLMPDGSGTRILVDGDVALAGVLGSVGQGVVERQAQKVTEAFARNLAQALAPSAPAPAAAEAPSPAPASAPAPIIAPTPAPSMPAPAAREPAPAPGPSIDFWVKLTAGLSAATLAIALILLGRALG